MDHKSITFTVAADLFLLLLIGVGPKIALVPFLEITADMDDATKRRVARKMLTTAAIVSMLLVVLGEELRRLLHFSIGSLSIASGLILVIIAVFRGANRVSDHLDESRMLVTEKIFGFLLAALAVQLALDGLDGLGVIHLSGH